MTITEAISLCDALRPNEYTRAEKLRWLTDIDGQLKRSVLDSHHRPGAEPDEPGSDPAPYTESDITASTPLQVPDPYAAELYRWYLTAQIAAADGETAEYNTAVSRYNAALLNFMDSHNRRTAPRRAVKAFKI